MSPEQGGARRHARLRELFRRLRDLDAEARRSALAEADLQDATLEAELLALLAEADHPGGLLGTTQFGRDLGRQARDALEPAPPPFELPSRVAGLRVLRKLAAGGMGQVWLARDDELDRLVALKTIGSRALAGGLDLDQLRREARLLASVDHPNVATIHAIEEVDGQPVLVMELVEGETLDELIGRGALETGLGLRVARQVALALEAAHARGVVHGDLKPGNVMIRRDGRVKLLDFGLAKSLEGGLASGGSMPFEAPGSRDGPEPSGDWIAPALDRTGLAGTPRYMSPEQLGGSSRDERCDVWAFGCLLFECLAGRPAFDQASLAATLEAIRVGRVELGSLSGKRPPLVLELVRDCLQADPARRPADGAELARRLGTAVGSLARATVGESWRLPAPSSSFVGREDDLATLGELLREQRLVTLLGTGGTGKTRVALRVAERAVECGLAAAAAFVDLSPLPPGSSVLPALGAALGLREERGQGLRDSILRSLREASGLLVLDNAEHVLDDCAVMAECLLSSCPGLRLLVTSREALALPAETTWLLGPLALPGSEGDLESVKGSPAVQLFLERARAASPRFAIDEGNAREIARLCRLLDGLPLALELAAARTRSLETSQLLARLEQGLSVLGGARGATRRQRTLEATLEWSHRLLDEPESVLMRRVAVFTGGFTADQAAAVGGEELSEAMDPLLHLVEKSLVTRSGATRFRLLRPVREHARAKLRAAGEQDVVGARHAEIFLQLALQAEAGLLGAAQDDWLQTLGDAHDDFRQALDELATRGEQARALRLAVALWTYWQVRGHWQEGRSLLEARVTAVGDAEAALRSRALIGIGALAEHQGDSEAACEALSRGLELARESGDDTATSACLAGLGTAAANRGELDEASSWLEEALHLARVGRDRHVETRVSNTLGNIAWARGKLEQAREHFESCQRLALACGDQRSAGAALTNLGSLAFMAGDAAEARRLMEDALDSHRALGNRALEAATLSNMASVLEAEGEPVSARALGREALALMRELGDRRGAAFALSAVGGLELEGGSLDGARRDLKEALLLFDELDVLLGLVPTLEVVGRLAARVGELAKAAQLFGGAESLRRANGLVREPHDERRHRAAAERVQAALGARWEPEARAGARLDAATLLQLALTLLR